MSKIEKKRRKLQDQLDKLEHDFKMSLKQKTSSTPEISIDDYMRKISELKTKLLMLS